MATLVQELTEDGAYDLDADPAVEAREATWLDADSVSPALARDKKLAVRVRRRARHRRARRRRRRARAPRRSGARSRRRRLSAARGARRRVARSPTRRGSSPAPPRRAGRRRSPGSRRAPTPMTTTTTTARRRGACAAPRRSSPALPRCSRHYLAGAAAGGPSRPARDRPRARRGRRPAAAAAALAATLEFAALEARCDAALEKDAASGRSPRRRLAGCRGGVRPVVAAASSPVGDLADPPRRGPPGRVRPPPPRRRGRGGPRRGSRRRGPRHLLADCGLKAGERAPARAREAEAGFALFGFIHRGPAGVGRRGPAAAGCQAARLANHLARRAASKPPVRSKAAAPRVRHGEYGPARRWRRILFPLRARGFGTRDRGVRQKAERRGAASPRRGVPYHTRGRPAAKRWRCAALFRCRPLAAAACAGKQVRVGTFGDSNPEAWSS